MEMDAPFDLSVARRVHVVGVGGAAMSAIAQILAAMGHAVSGSDAAPSKVLDRLADGGVDVHVGHDPAWLDGADLVVASTAVPDTDAELAAAIAAGTPVVRRPEVMAALCQARRTVGVAGAHGKTTTTALLASVLREGGLDPSFIVGGMVTGLDTGAHWGSGEWFAVEADESDGTFLRLGAEAVIVTNVEPDHLDHWGSFESLRAGYRKFIEGASGPRIVCADDPAAAALAREVGGCITYGTHAAADARMTDVATGPDGVSFALEWRDERLPLRVPQPGLHNARNAAAVAVLALELGVGPEAVQAGVAGFTGVARRFERRGEAAGITFVDSYDHLPAEVGAVLAAAREGGWRRIVCVFQPHRYTRVRDLWPDFGDVFVDADVLAVTEIYLPEGAVRLPGVSGKLIVNAVLDAHPRSRVAWLPDRDALRSWLLAELRPGDLCLTLNAGDLTTLPDELLPLLSGSLATRPDTVRASRRRTEA